MKIVHGARPRTAATSAALTCAIQASTSGQWLHQPVAQPCAKQHTTIGQPSHDQPSQAAGHQAPIARPARKRPPNEWPAARDQLRNFERPPCEKEAPSPFVPYLLNPRTLFSRELSGDFPSFSMVVLLVRGFYQSLRDFSQGRAAIPHSHLPAGIVATMRRVVKYHSSWARQQQVELLDASGNPGPTAGRGFNPAGGAPGGG
ncbi:hypothetical protein F511_29054 [Dorcoceras hygrometricum]|uniref:Uncharacterized protein n=1 Tax=Dorcoceras hygrometricum TaxID=472368 RepID=A0A2Z7CLC7_9LAMI|nr:hypothetical protein F511_29054 [Dorcoceras hygrometricum]